MSDVLAAIVAATRHDLGVRKAHVPLDVLHRRLAAQPGPRGARFAEQLARPTAVNIIAECKRRSPSRGVLAPAYDPVALARTYEAGGAAAISVLTEPSFFDGTLAHLAAVREAVTVPVLRKDFVVDEYQLAEAAAHGADAVLLIASVLDDDTLRRLHRTAGALHLAALVEVHDEVELSRALDAGATIVGVNNRSLRTLDVDTSLSSRLAARIPRGVIAVSESGLADFEDIARLRACGYSAFLVGERLMTAADPLAMLRALQGAEVSR